MTLIIEFETFSLIQTQLVHSIGTRVIRHCNTDFSFVYKSLGNIAWVPLS